MVLLLLLLLLEMMRHNIAATAIAAAHVCSQVEIARGDATEKCAFEWRWACEESHRVVKCAASTTTTAATSTAIAAQQGVVGRCGTGT